MFQLSAMKSEKNIKRFSNECQKCIFWAKSGPNLTDLGKFGPNEKVHSTLVESAYYALTFSEEIRKKYQAVFK